jgi:hypothetical protein
VQSAEMPAPAQRGVGLAGFFKRQIGGQRDRAMQLRTIGHETVEIHFRQRGGSDPPRPDERAKLECGQKREFFRLGEPNESRRLSGAEDRRAVRQGKSGQHGGERDGGRRIERDIELPQLLVADERLVDGRHHHVELPIGEAQAHCREGGHDHFCCNALSCDGRR